MLTHERHRITSTYVENTVPNGVGVIDAEDHLHIRGEYLQFNIQEAKNGGSPPHTWRIQEVKQMDQTITRITSTYVENTTGVRKIPHQNKDHLHIRGEYKHKNLVALATLGSPPHTWRIL